MMLNLSTLQGLRTVSQTCAVSTHWQWRYSLSRMAPTQARDRQEGGSYVIKIDALASCYAYELQVLNLGQEIRFLLRATDDIFFVITCRIVRTCNEVKHPGTLIKLPNPYHQSTDRPFSLDAT